MGTQQAKIVIVGHVDHGKSTVIGRLLAETGTIPAEKIKELQAKAKQNFQEFEYAHLLDALEEEQEQNITIDITQIILRADGKEYLLIDAPGHREFVKNMICGAASADAALLLVDAREGIREQTRQHAYLLSMIGIQKVLVVINKMDLAGYQQVVFSQIADEITALFSQLGLQLQGIIPVAARTGENLVRKSENMSWWDKPVLIEQLVSLEVESEEQEALRFPVQDVYKWDGKRRIVGRVESGRLREEDRIIFSPSLKETTVKEIEQWNTSNAFADMGDSIGITMHEQIFVERGEIASHPAQKPDVTEEFRAKVFWLGKSPLRVHQKYLLKLATQERECEIILIRRRIDPSTLVEMQERASEIMPHEVGEVTIATKRPIALDTFSQNTKTGRFVLVDGYNVAGGGIVTETLGTHRGTDTS